MKRKVVKHGPSTFIISLPSKWIRKYDVAKGDELEVEETENTILISTEKGRKLGNVEVDVSDLDRSSLMYLIRGLYKLGYDEIKVTYKEQSTKHYRLQKNRTILSVIHEEINRLTGIEIIQQRSDYCIIKTLSEMSYREFDTMLRRVFLLILDMSNDMCANLKKLDLISMETFEEKHNTINKFLALCVRIVNKKGTGNSLKNHLVHSILAILDKIVDAYKHTARLVIIHQPQFKSTSIIENMHRANEIFYKMYYKFSNAKVVEFAKIRDETIKRLNSNISKYSKEELIVILTLIPVLDLIVAMVEYRMAIDQL
ncbi:AbrB/MazE/SpoVT family DNA-binding domain-containing protein [Candidatus Woesearchaeota archaeon]|nr:AbrB/MazE/SpoVT family DNA-binding domain-containing protein [Candidatus Woesearchaeota archaeon]